MQNLLKKYIIVSVLVLGGIFFAANAYAATPSMITTPATNLGINSATLNGQFSTTNLGSTSVRFEYGTTTLLGSSTGYQSYSTGSGTYSEPLTSLLPNTIYYYRAMGIDGTTSGPQFGTTLNFQTANSVLPTVDTYAAQVNPNGSVTLNGYFNANGSSVTTWFEYANNTSFAGSSTTPATPRSGISGPFNDTVTGLTQGVTYYFRAVAQNAGGKTDGNRLNFIITPSVINPTCTIGSFNASQSSVPVGGTVVLSWSSSGCTSGSLTANGNTISTLVTSSGLPVTQTVNTTYTLTLSGPGAGNTSTQSQTVTISNINNPTCSIDYFNANATNITAGNPVTFNWSSTSCVSATLSPNGGSSISSSLSATAFTVAPQVTTTYVLYMSGNGAGNNTSRSVTVTVGNNTNNPCQINSFRANPNSVTNGALVEFTWNTSNCSNVTLNGVPYSSPIRLYPNGNTQYRLFANSNYPYTSDTRVLYINIINGNGSSSGGGSSSSSSSSSGGYGVTAPVATTFSVPNVSGTTVIITGSAYSNGDNWLRTWFEYGPTPALGTGTVMQTFGMTANPAAKIYNLNKYTTYYFRIVAQNSRGTSYGSIYSFQTGGPISTGDTTVNNKPSSSSTSSTSSSSTSTGGGTTNPDITSNDYNASLGANAGSNSGAFSGFNFLWLLLLVIIILIIIIITRSMALNKKEKDAHHPAH